jgi:hypothetical protein
MQLADMEVSSIRILPLDDQKEGQAAVVKVVTSVSLVAMA